MRATLTFAIISLAAISCGAEPTDKAAIRLAATIPLKSVRGRIDHMALDKERQLFYVAALENNTVEVIDLKAGKQVATIDGLKKPQGIAVLPETGDVVVASGDDGKCRKYSPELKLLGTIDGLDDADNVRYDATAHVVYVGYGDGALAVIDANTFTKVADIKLNGHPESFQLQFKGRWIFVNVPDAGHVAVIDRGEKSAVEKWSLTGAKANFPMALDEDRNRLFVGCRQPSKLLVLDTESGKTVATLDCCGDADDVFYDAANRQVLVSGGEGCVSVFSQVDADTYKLAGKISTAGGARTSFFAPSLGRLFVAVPLRGTQAAEILAFEVSSPQLASP